MSDLLSRGVLINPHEAVAIVQQLTEVRWDQDAAQTLSPANLLLTSEGTVRCEGCTEPTDVKAAELLDVMLTAVGGVRVAGPLRLTVARGCRAVDAPPYGSLAAFSAALVRFERGDRSEVIRQLVQRAAGACAPEAAAASASAASPSPAPVVADSDRRRPTTRASQLRRDLREADARLFELMNRTDSGESLSASVERAGTLRVGRFQIAGAAAAILLSFIAGYLVMTGLTTGTGRWRHLAPSARSLEASASRSVPIDAPAPPDSRSETPSHAAPRVDGQQGQDGREGQDRLDKGVGTQTTSVVPAVMAFAGPQFSPAFAPDGRAIYFHTGRSSDGRSALVLSYGRDAHPPVTALVNDGAKNYHVQPSPDGLHLAFDSDRDGERGVYVADSDGTHAHRVSGPAYAAVPTWAPDGRRLAFVRGGTTRPSVWNLSLLSLDSGEIHPLTSYAYGQTWGASWFPDGTHICYAHEDTIVVMNLNTRERREFRTPLSGHMVRTPAVDPGGDHVVFQVYRSGAWLLDLESAAMTPLLADATAEEFAWSPDGGRVAFHSRRSGDWRIWTLSLDALLHHRPVAVPRAVALPHG